MTKNKKFKEKNKRRSRQLKPGSGSEIEGSALNLQPLHSPWRSFSFASLKRRERRRREGGESSNLKSASPPQTLALVFEQRSGARGTGISCLGGSLSRLSAVDRTSDTGVRLVFARPGLRLRKHRWDSLGLAKWFSFLLYRKFGTRPCDFRLVVDGRQLLDFN